MIIILRHCVWARHPALLRSQPSLWGWTPVPGTWQLLGYIALVSFPLSRNSECNRCNYSVQSRKSMHTHVTLSPIHLRSLCKRIIEMLWCLESPHVHNTPWTCRATMTPRMANGTSDLRSWKLHMNCKSVSLSTVIFDVVFAFPFCSSICQPRFCFKSCTVLGKSSQFRESHAPSLSWECGTDMAVWRQTSLKSLALLSKRPTETEARPSTTHNVVLDLTNWQHNCEKNGILSYRLIFLKFGLIDYCDTDNNFASLASLRRMRCRRSSTPHCPLGLVQRPCWIVCEISPASHAVSTNTGKFCEIKSKQPLRSTSKRSASSPCTLPRRICRI